MDAIERMSYLRGVLKLSDLELFVALEMPDLKDEEIHPAVRSAISNEALDWTLKLSEPRRAVFVAIDMQYGEDGLLLLSKAARAAKKENYKEAGAEIRAVDWCDDISRRWRYANQMTNDLWSWRWKD